GHGAAGKDRRAVAFKLERFALAVLAVDAAWGDLQVRIGGLGRNGPDDEVPRDLKASVAGAEADGLSLTASGPKARAVEGDPRRIGVGARGDGKPAALQGKMPGGAQSKSLIASGVERPDAGGVHLNPASGLGGADLKASVVDDEVAVGADFHRHGAVFVSPERVASS